MGVYEISDAYDTQRLLWLPPRLRDIVDDLDLHLRLGADAVENGSGALRLSRATSRNSVVR